MSSAPPKKLSFFSLSSIALSPMPFLKSRFEVLWRTERDFQLFSGVIRNGLRGTEEERDERKGEVRAESRGEHGRWLSIAVCCGLNGDLIQF